MLHGLCYEYRCGYVNLLKLRSLDIEICVQNVGTDMRIHVEHL